VGYDHYHYYVVDQEGGECISPLLPPSVSSTSSSFVAAPGREVRVADSL